MYPTLIHCKVWLAKYQFPYKNPCYALEVTLKKNPSVARMKIYSNSMQEIHLCPYSVRERYLISRHYVSVQYFLKGQIRMRGCLHSSNGVQFELDLKAGWPNLQDACPVQTFRGLSLTVNSKILVVIFHVPQKDKKMFL